MSDVWSFAVTLWEILGMANEQPYEQMVNLQVIENLGNLYRSDNRMVGYLLNVNIN